MISRMKRKELDEVNDDFSGFSLSTPAAKIRRLDAELPPIMEEEESQSFPVFQQPDVPLEQNLEVAGELVGENEERAIVLFKPLTTAPLASPSTYSVSSDILSSLRDPDLWSKHANLLRSSTDEAEGKDKISEVSNQCLAVVPWVQPQLPQAQKALVQELDATEMMEAEENEVASMDIENEYVGVEQRLGSQFGGSIGSEGSHQWQQQHCVVPQLPQDAAASVVWFR